MSQQPSFITTQYQFSNAIRDPGNNPTPDNIEQRRMTIYQELFYNNIEGFIANAFPVLREIIEDKQWHEMIRDFMAKHRCKTPLFHEVSREFLAYLENEHDSDNSPGFINELAHYEWVELALSVADVEVNPATVNDVQNVLSPQFELSPLAWSLTYQYPVHQIGPDFQPEQPSEAPIYLLVYRDNEDSVTFLELNPVSARLIELLNEGLNGQAASQKIAQELQHPNPEVVSEGAKSLMTDWLQRGLLVKPNLA